MLVIDRETVHRLLPVADAVDVMRGAFVGLHEGRIDQPLRTLLQPPGIPGVAVIKPALVSGGETAFGMKIVTQFNGNAAYGLDAVQGVVLLLDPATGLPQALVEAGAITEIRTAAVSGLATDLLAPAGACDLAVLGAGVQARSHLKAMAAVRTLRRVRLWNRTPERARSLAAEAAGFGLGVEVEVMETAADAVAGADLICTTTSSPDPVLAADIVAPGAHINAVGAFQPATRELESGVVLNATVFVDSRESALAESGDLLIAAAEAGLDPGAAIAASLDEVVTGAHPGRKAPEEITLFKSLGLALEDVEAAAEVFRRARASGAGTDVAFP